MVFRLCYMDEIVVRFGICIWFCPFHDGRKLISVTDIGEKHRDVSSRAEVH